MEKIPRLKKFGQHFLKNKHIVERLVSLADVQEGDLVIEIGPGKGIVTAQLVERGAEVICLEIDARLFEFLNNRFEGYPVTLVNADALVVNFNEITKGREYKLVSSLPFQITSPLLNNIVRLSFKNQAPKITSLLIQFEVARKVTSPPPDATFMGQLMAASGELHYIQKVRKGDFSPRPEVDGGIITFRPRPDARITDIEKFGKFLHHGFLNPRKMIKHNFPEEVLLKANVDPTLRPQALKFEDWVALFQVL